MMMIICMITTLALNHDDNEQDGKIGCCVLFTGKATYNYGNLTDVNLGKNAEVGDS